MVLLNTRGHYGRHIVRRFFASQSTQSAAAILEAVQKQAQFFGVDPSQVYDPYIQVDAFQRAAYFIHDNITHDWAAALISLAAIFRIASLPLYASSLIKGKRRAEAARELTDLRDMAKEAVLLRDQTLVQDIDKEYKQRMKAYGLTGNPLQGFGYLFCAQIPWVATMLFALRGMATQPAIFESFVIDSQFLWCDSLALADPYGLLPLVSSTAIVLSSKGSEKNNADPSLKATSLSKRDQVYIRYAIKGACFTFMPFAMQLPAGILIFFIFNTIFNRLAAPLIQRFLWKPVSRPI